MAKGLTQQFTALGTYTDNSTSDLTSQVAWASATTSVATINATTGLATAVAPGTSNISAALGNVTGTTVMTVTAAALKSIALSPVDPTVAKGLTQQFTATGTYTDDSTADLTSQVVWASATTSVATINATTGLATAVAPGTSNISATLGNVTGTTVMTVTAATLSSIAINPANPTVAKGLTQQFTALGTYTDDSTADLTSQVVWASATTSVATINATTGLATAVAPGTSNISATLGNVTGTTVMTVTAATLKSIALSPVDPTVAKGFTEQFTATGTYSDGSTQDLTNQVTWVSASPNVATIAANGLATTLAVGTTDVTASLNDVTSPVDTLTVTNAALQSIALTPVDPSVALGFTEQFTATGTYSDGSTQDLTNQVTWVSASPNVATIAANGLATTLAVGATDVTASLNDVTSPVDTLTVTAPSIVVMGVSVGWGSESVSLQTQSDGLRLLPAGRTTDLPWFNINQITHHSESGRELESGRRQCHRDHGRKLRSGDHLRVGDKQSRTHSRQGYQWSGPCDDHHRQQPDRNLHKAARRAPRGCHGRWLREYDGRRHDP